jgi:hypothetical protein
VPENVALRLGAPVEGGNPGTMHQRLGVGHPLIAACNVASAADRELLIDAIVNTHHWTAKRGNQTGL